MDHITVIGEAQSEKREQTWQQTVLMYKYKAGLHE